MRVLFSFLLLICVNTVLSQSYPKGELVFSSNCVACHKMDDALVGPKLNTVVKLHGEEWTKSWIKNNVELRESGDKHAKEVYEAYGKQAMPVYEGMLSEEELDDLVFYLENWDDKQKEEAAAAAAAEPATLEVDGGYIEVRIERTIQALILVCFLILILAYWFLYKSFKLMSKMYFKGRMLQTYLLRSLDMRLDEAETELNDYIEERVDERVTIRKKHLKKLLNQKIDDIRFEEEKEDWFSKVYEDEY